jgi:hypothetical protein
MSDPSQSNHEISRFLGLVLMVLGILAMTGAGLCSGGLVITGLVEGVSLSDAIGMLPMIALAGGAGVGVGIALYAFGRMLRPRS